MRTLSFAGKFATMMVAVTLACSASAAPIRALLVHPDEFTDRWIDRAVSIKLDVLSMHPVGGWDADKSLTNLIFRCHQPEFRARVDRAIAKGLTVEYECHAGTWLLPRNLFATHPEYFRMDKDGKRQQRFNFCVSNEAALDIVAKRARELVKSLYRSSNRYYFWLDDVSGSHCMCPKCAPYSPSDQQLIVLNRMLAEMRKEKPDAKLAFLAYASTLKPPTRIKPAEGIFVEYAPIHRKWDKPVSEQQDKVKRADVEALLAYFGKKDSRLLEYWYDNSLFSGWKKPPKKFAVHPEVLKADLKWYEALGFDGIASFACYLGDDYEKLWGEPDVSAFAKAPEMEYGIDVAVDFGKIVGKVNPKLHSSGWGPRLCPRSIRVDDDDIKAMGLYAARTHDWALINAGQRVVDTHFIFPMMHLDAKDPKNYFFEPTDDLLNLSRKLGLKICYRLGSSIEHTSGKHYNVLAPADADKYAEVLAGIMRHYLKGWANGYEWGDDFTGWEIWNEPDGINNCWVLPGCEGDDPKTRNAKHQTAFCKFFAKVLKRLKAEFPDQQIGGPALCSPKESYFNELLDACKAEGVKPDFISWHGYYSWMWYSWPDTPYPQDSWAIVKAVAKMRKLLDDKGFKDTRTMVNEWHFIKNWDGIHGKNSSVSSIRQALEGPSGHVNIDSAAFNVVVLCRLQETSLDEAYYYGCGEGGHWGYKGEYGRYNKCWYSMKMFGDFVRQTDDRVESQVATNLPAVAACAGWSKDRRTASMVLGDYGGCKKGKFFVKLRDLKNVKRTTGYILDNEQNMSPIALQIVDDTLILDRNDDHSVCYLVTFEL